MSLSLVTAAAAYPLDATTAKLHVRQDATADDDLIEDILIPAVTERGEAATGRAFITQIWDLILDGFPRDGWIEIPKPPLQSVTHVKYRDTNGDLQTWDSANYVVEAPAGPRCRRGRLSLAYNVSWPSTYGQAGDVQIRFVCGYGASGTAVPALLRSAMLLDFGMLYENREQAVAAPGVVVAQLPLGLKDMYRSHCSHATQRLR